MRVYDNVSNKLIIYIMKGRSEEDEVGGTCDTNGREEGRV
jgi:hypothetical protein